MNSKQHTAEWRVRRACNGKRTYFLGDLQVSRLGSYWELRDHSGDTVNRLGQFVTCVGTLKKAKSIGDNVDRIGMAGYIKGLYANAVPIGEARA